MTSTYYRPSGRFSSMFVTRAAITTVTLLLFAALYAWSALNLHAFLSMVVAPVILAVLMIGSGVSLCEKAQVRSPLSMSIITLAMTVGVWYFHWAVWATLSDPLAHAKETWPSLVAYLKNPEAMRAMAMAPQRWNTPNMLGAIMEIILFIVIPVASAREAASKPFCETSKTWPKEEKLPRRFGAIPKADLKQFIADLEAAPDQFMTLLPAYVPGAPEYTTLSVHQSQGGKESWLTLTNVVEKFVDGKPNNTWKEIVTCLTISAAAARQACVDCALDNGVQAGAAMEAPNDDDDVDDDEDSEEQPTPAELEPALAALQVGEFEEALALARPFAQAGDAQLRTDANRMCAMSCSRLEQWSAAAGYWESVFAAERSAHNALQVATSKVMAGELAEGEEWIEKTKKINEETGDITSILIHTNFISALKRGGYLRAALPYLEWVKQAYETLHSTDGTFLTVRGVPFFESFLDQSEAIVDASLDRAQANAWYASMLAHIDQDGQDVLNAWLAQRAAR